jgi:hypothetical protein
MGMNTIKKSLWTAQALDSSTVTTEWIDVSQLTKGSFSFVWSGGSSPVGTVTILVSNTQSKSDANTLTLSATLSVSGSSGAHVANLDDIPSRFVALRYTGASGTATAAVDFFGKGNGQ